LRPSIIVWKRKSLIFGQAKLHNLCRHRPNVELYSLCKGI
jgi:hypothetical protein